MLAAIVFSVDLCFILGSRPASSDRASGLYLAAV